MYFGSKTTATFRAFVNILIHIIRKTRFVNDVADVNECGDKTKEINEYINDEINKRRMQLSVDKCVRMHVQSKKHEKAK